jgi:hypothetical protein
MKPKRQITHYDINASGQLTHMIAADLFYGDSAKQVFSAKTGKWLGTIQRGKELNFAPEIEPEEATEPEIKNPAQLSFF